MKQIAKGLILLSALTVSSGAVAAVCADFNPYIGAYYLIDLMKGNMAWKNVFPRNYQGGGVYVGNRFLDYWGVEIGADSSTVRKREWSIPVGTAFFGGRDPVALNGTTKLRRRSVYLDALGYLPVGGCFELIGSLGIGWVQPKVEFKSFSLPSGSTLNGTALASVTGKGAGVLRVGFGVSYMVTDIVGLKAKVNYETTSRLYTEGNAFFTGLGYNKKAFRNTMGLNLGIFARC